MVAGRAAALIVTAWILLFPSPASAHDLTPEKTKIMDLVLTEGAAGLDVSGTASFGGQKLLKLATDPENDSVGGIKELDLLEAKMAQLDPATGDLNFVFKLADLPPTGGIPSVIDYFWEFRLAPLESPVFRIQTSFSTLATVTGDPMGLLHTCPTPGQGCHATAVTAEYVGSDNEIFVDIPKGLLESKIGGPLGGLHVEPGPAGWDSVKTAVFDEPGDVLAPWDQYEIAYQRVDIGIAPPGSAPTTSTAADVTSDGSFSASLDTAGFAPGEYDVVAKACYGTNCATWRTRILL